MRSALVALGLLLAACAGPGVEGQIAGACQAYANALRVSAALRADMTPSQVRVVDDVVLVVGPTCRQAASQGIAGLPVDGAGVLATVLGETRRILLINTSVGG